MAKHRTFPGAHTNLIKTTLIRIAASRREARRSGWRQRLLHKFAHKGVWAQPATTTPDPVSLAIFAIDRVGPAAVRACASGLEVRVAAPDEATARVFRAALAETARRRTTDQLIRIVVVEGDSARVNLDSPAVTLSHGRARSRRSGPCV
jgi:hypothetical protein